MTVPKLPAAPLAANDHVSPEVPYRAATLKHGGGDGTFGGMDPWQQTVETRLGELRADVRDLSNKVDSRFFWLLAAYGGGFILLAGLIGKSAHWW